jgi:hypothetical protein
MRCGRLVLLLLGALALGGGVAAAAQAAPRKRSKPTARQTSVARATKSSLAKSSLAKSSLVSAAGVDNAHVQVQWSAVSGAATYQVYRGSLLVGTTAGTSFTDSLLWPATLYSYNVVPVAATGGALQPLTVSASTTPLPATGFPSVFGASSIWSAPVGSAQTAPNSAGQIAYLLAHLKSPNMTLRAWGVSVAETHVGDPTFDVPCLVYTSCTLGTFGRLPIPVTAAADPSADGQLAVYDPSGGREWDMWQASNRGGVWSSAAGAGVSTGGNGIVPAGTAAGDAANFPLLGGLIRPEEILQGHIDHPLVFTMPGVSSVGHVCPATHNDGWSSDPNALEEGTRLQLDPSVNVDALSIPAWEKPVVRAMQAYGMYLRDGGGSFAIYAENPVSRGYDAWSKVGISGGDQVGLSGIPWSKLRVVTAPC